MLDIVKSKPKKRIRDKIKDFFDNKVEVTIFSFSLLLIAILLFIVGDSVDSYLQDQRKLIGTLFFVIFFFILPLDFNKKDRLLQELSKFSLSIGGFILIISYFLYYKMQNIVFDLFFSFLLVPILFYLIKRTYLIFKALCQLIQIFTNTLVNTKDEKKGFLCSCHRIIPFFIFFDCTVINIKNILKILCYIFSHIGQ